MMKRILVAALAAVVLVAAFGTAGAAETKTKYEFRMPFPGLHGAAGDTGDTGDATCEMSNQWVDTGPDGWMNPPWGYSEEDAVQVHVSAGCKTLVFKFAGITTSNWNGSAWVEARGDEVDGEFPLPAGDATVYALVSGAADIVLYVDGVPVAVAAGGGSATQSQVENGAIATAIVPNSAISGANPFIRVE